MSRTKAGYTDFIGIPRKVADSAAFKSLPALARALYVDLRRQHNGYNNGQIAAVLKGTEERPGLEAYGWPARSVFKFVKLLLEHGLIEKTRQGGIGALSKQCTLYAFTDLSVIAHKEKRIAGSQPSLAYLHFEAARGAYKAARGAYTQLHVVPSELAKAAPRAASDFTEKVA